MNLDQTIQLQTPTPCRIGIHAGGPGSGCQGENCGRPPGSGTGEGKGGGKWDVHRNEQDDHRTPDQKREHANMKNEVVGKLGEFHEDIRMATRDDEHNPKYVNNMLKDIEDFRRAIETDSNPDGVKLRGMMRKIASKADDILDRDDIADYPNIRNVMDRISKRFSE